MIQAAIITGTQNSKELTGGHSISFFPKDREYDTPEPGVTPLKWKLSIPEAANSNICQGS